MLSNVVNLIAPNPPPAGGLGSDRMACIYTVLKW